MTVLKSKDTLFKHLDDFYRVISFRCLVPFEVTFNVISSSAEGTHNSIQTTQVIIKIVNENH